MFEVLTAHGYDAERWAAYWERLPDHLRDVMFSPAYARVQDTGEHGTSLCAVYVWEKYFVLQPFVFRQAPGGKKDIASLYGGGGPVTNLEGWSRRALWEWFDREFGKWREQNSVVCEYAQLHPICALTAPTMLNAEWITQTKEIVVIKIDTDDVMLSCMTPGRRQTLERGQRAGLVAKRIDFPGNHIGEFYRLYCAAMERKNAAERWILPAEYFLKYFSELGPFGTALVATEGANTITTMAIVVFGGKYAHFHFAASIENSPQGSSDLTIFESARIARAAGAQYLNLGGGVTSSEKDSLLWYKGGFSPVREPVYSVKRIFDQAAYSELCTAAKVAPDEKFFPQYRAKVAA